MKLSFSTIGCPEWSYGDIISAARDLQYQGVEVRGIGSRLHAPEIPQFAPDAIADTKKQLESLGLVIPCLSTDCVLHMRAWRERMEKEIGEYIALASALNVPYLRVMADDPRPHPAGEVDTAHVIDFARALAAPAEKAGVTLLIETNGWFCETKRLRSVIEAIGSCNVAALWDVHHPYRFAGESPETTIANLGGLIRHVHIKDSVMTNGAVRYALTGRGDLPLERMIGALGGAGYDGFYSLEWVRRWDLSLEAPGIVFAHYVPYMRSL